jgi:hypothetical protein
VTNVAAPLRQPALAWQLRGRTGELMKLTRWLLALTSPVLVLATAPGRANAASVDIYDGNWHFSLTPYVWAPAFSGDLDFDPPVGSRGKPSVNAGAFDLLKFLNFAFMGTAEARKAAWEVFTDLAYVDLSSKNGSVRQVVGPGSVVQIPINIQTKVGLTAAIWTSGLGYSVFHDDATSVILFAGFRGMSTDPSVEWSFSGPLDLLPQSGRISRHQELWDGLIGVRGQMGFRGSQWSIPYYLDIGTGASNFTTEASAGVAYGFSWGDLQLDYRYLHYEQGNGKLIRNIDLDGLTIGVTFQL